MDKERLGLLYNKNTTTLKELQNCFLQSTRAYMSTLTIVGVMYIHYKKTTQQFQICMKKQSSQL